MDASADQARSWPSRTAPGSMGNPVDGGPSPDGPSVRWRLATPIDLAAPIDPMESTEPIEPMDRNDPMEPMESADPMEPMESTEPMEPMERAAPMERIARTEPMASTESAEPMEPMEWADPVEPCPGPEVVARAEVGVRQILPMDPTLGRPERNCVGR